ncbi:MAG: hypothetical protein MHM6MM_004254 [Cercozoa sp. M6MM]
MGERQIKWSEVEQHDGREDAAPWTVVDGVVYDASDLVRRHPGGDVVRIALGREATSLVQSYHPPASMKAVKAYLANKAPRVGVLCSQEVPRANLYPDHRQLNHMFRETVRQRAAEKLASLGRAWRGDDTWMAIEVFVSLLLYLTFVFLKGYTGQWYWSIPGGIIGGRLGFLMHMGLHAGQGESAFVNKCAGALMDILGASSVLWQHDHQVAHHLTPNELGLDNDCEIGYPIMRFHEGLERKWYHKRQDITTMVLMSGGLIKWLFSDIFDFIAARVGHVSFHIRTADWFVLLPAKACYVLLHVYLPAQRFGWTTAILNTVLMMVVASYYLESIFISNHIQNKLVPPKRADWAIKQVLGSANWASGSHVWNFLSGGLNHQVEHHLFPSMCCYNYPYVSDVVKRTCREFGLPYFNFPSFAEAHSSMRRFLRELGDNDTSDYVHPDLVDDMKRADAIRSLATSLEEDSTTAKKDN